MHAPEPLNRMGNNAVTLRLIQQSQGTQFFKELLRCYMTWGLALGNVVGVSINEGGFYCGAKSGIASGAQIQGIQSAWFRSPRIAVYPMNGSNKKLTLSVMRAFKPLNPNCELGRGKTSALYCADECSNIDTFRKCFGCERVARATIQECRELSIINLSNYGMCCGKVIPRVSALIKKEKNRLH